MTLDTKLLEVKSLYFFISDKVDGYIRKDDSTKYLAFFFLMKNMRKRFIFLNIFFYTKKQHFRRLFS